MGRGRQAGKGPPVLLRAACVLAKLAPCREKKTPQSEGRDGEPPTLMEAAIRTFHTALTLQAQGLPRPRPLPVLAPGERPVYHSGWDPSLWGIETAGLGCYCFA